MGTRQTYVSKKWPERKVLIAEELAKSRYDIVSLQEIWSRGDFEFISQKIEDVLPYSHYFYSGVNGSGVCVFSRYPIIDAFTYRYSLNGYMYNITHGDWFGGKAAGYCLIDHPKQPIHFFSTHMHADYNEKRQYLPHRIVQSYQLSQFIEHLTQPTDAVIVCGDMNCEPSQLCYRVIKDVTCLVDAWDKHGKVKHGCYGNTSNVSHNTFSGDRNTSNTLQGGPDDGKRIDYIFYRCTQGSLECVDCEVSMGLVPGKNFSFSDHEAVAASFVVKESALNKTDSIQEAGPDVKKSQEALSDTQEVISKALDNLSSQNHFQIFVACVMFLFVISPIIFPVGEHSPLSLHHVAGKILYLVRIFTTIILTGFIFYLILNTRDEYSAYRSVQQMIGIQLNQISPRKRMKFLTVK